MAALAAMRALALQTQAPMQWPSTHAPMHATAQPQSLAPTPLLAVRDEETFLATGADCFGSFIAFLPF